MPVVHTAQLALVACGQRGNWTGRSLRLAGQHRGTSRRFPLLNNRIPGPLAGASLLLFQNSSEFLPLGARRTHADAYRRAKKAWATTPLRMPSRRTGLRLFCAHAWRAGGVWRPHNVRLSCAARLAAPAATLTAVNTAARMFSCMPRAGLSAWKEFEDRTAYLQRTLALLRAHLGSRRWFRKRDATSPRSCENVRVAIRGGLTGTRSGVPL